MLCYLFPLSTHGTAFGKSGISDRNAIEENTIEIFCSEHAAWKIIFFDSAKRSISENRKRRVVSRADFPISSESSQRGPEKKNGCSLFSFSTNDVAFPLRLLCGFRMSMVVGCNR